MQDIPLATILRSPIFAFTDNDLISIRLTDRSCSFYESMIKARLTAEEGLKNKIENVICYFDKWREKEKIFTIRRINMANIYRYKSFEHSRANAKWSNKTS